METFSDGDKVEFVESYSYNSVSYSRGYTGEVVVSYKSTTYKDRVCVKLDAEFHGGIINVPVTHIKKAFIFHREDVKPGMLVRLRNNRLAFIVKSRVNRDSLELTRDDGITIQFSSYDQSFRYTENNEEDNIDHDVDIMQIYYCTADPKIVWERLLLSTREIDYLKHSLQTIGDELDKSQQNVNKLLETRMKQTSILQKILSKKVVSLNG